MQKVPYGARLHVDENDAVKRGQRLAQWDPYTRPILTEVDGVVEFEDLVEGISIREVSDEVKGTTNRVIVDWRATPRGSDLKPALLVKDGKGGKTIRVARGVDARYLLSVDAVLSIEPGMKVKAGDVLARVPTASAKTGDITGGLPRVAELFEARRPKDHAIIAEVSGTIEFGKDYKNKQRININPDDETLADGRTVWCRVAVASLCSMAIALKRVTSSWTAIRHRTTSLPSRASKNSPTI